MITRERTDNQVSARTRKQSLSLSKVKNKPVSQNKGLIASRSSKKQQNVKNSKKQQTIQISSSNVSKLYGLFLKLKRGIPKEVKQQDLETLLKYLRAKTKTNFCNQCTLIKRLCLQSNFITAVQTVSDQVKQQILKIFNSLLQQKQNKESKKLISSIEALEQLFNRKMTAQPTSKQKQKNLIKKQPERQYQIPLRNLRSDKKPITEIRQLTPIKPKKQPEKLVLQVENPLCPSENCKNPLQDKICPNKNHLMAICEKCKWKNHSQCETTIQLQDIPISTKMKINATGVKFDFFPLRSIPKLRSQKENNIKQVVQNQYKFNKEQRIIPGAPSEIFCSYPIISGKGRDIVMKNRDDQFYLALEIKESTIPGAGLGVFATANIDQVDSLVCSYRGQIGIGSKTPIMRSQKNKKLRNDSIFTLGWLGNEILIIAPNIYSNVGRFINFNTPEECNLKPHLCLIQKSQGDYEIAVFLTTIKKIKAGDELFYCYGNDYYV